MLETMITMKDLTAFLKEHLEDENLARLSRETKIPRNLLFEWIKVGRVPSFQKIRELEKLFDHIGVIPLRDYLFEPKAENRVVASIKFEDNSATYQITVSKNTSKDII